jgi:hypothetical protein
MYLLTRISTVPNSPLTIQIDGAPDGTGDGVFQGGGVYYFQPAGQEGDRHQVGEHQARIIMGDRGLAPHFSCDPALPSAEPEAEPTAESADGGQPDGTSGTKRTRRKATQG